MPPSVERGILCKKSNPDAMKYGVGTGFRLGERVCGKEDSHLLYRHPLYESETNRRFATISRVALRKLIQMNQACELRDLAIPPGNRLEALKGRLSGLFSIRVNNRWRIVFRWTDAGPAQVAIIDYH